MAFALRHQALLYLFIIYTNISRKDASLNGVCFDFQTSSKFTGNSLYYLLNFHLFTNATDLCFSRFEFNALLLEYPVL